MVGQKGRSARGCGKRDKSREECGGLSTKDGTWSTAEGGTEGR